MDGGDPTLLTGIALFIILLMSYWALRGIGQLFERYNPILVILYFFLLFPGIYAYMFGRSKNERLQRPIEDEVDHQLRIEEEKQKRLR